MLENVIQESDLKKKRKTFFKSTKKHLDIRNILVGNLQAKIML